MWRIAPHATSSFACESFGGQVSKGPKWASIRGFKPSTSAVSNRVWHVSSLPNPHGLSDAIVAHVHVCTEKREELQVVSEGPTAAMSLTADFELETPLWITPHFARLPTICTCTLMVQGRFDVVLILVERFYACGLHKAEDRMHSLVAAVTRRRAVHRDKPPCLASDDRHFSMRATTPGGAQSGCLACC